DRGIRLYRCNAWAISWGDLRLSVSGSGRGIGDHNLYDTVPDQVLRALLFLHRAPASGEMAEKPELILFQYAKHPGGKRVENGTEVLWKNRRLQRCVVIGDPIPCGKRDSSV